MQIHISKTIRSSYDDAIIQVTELLKENGFGVISTTHLHDKFKEKLNIDYRRYTILGACNPKFAHEALVENDKIGVFLPCNILVQEWEENKVEISAVNPETMVALTESSKMKDLTNLVKEKLQNVISKLQ